MKPHRGKIYNWKKVGFDQKNYPDLPPSMQYVILGTRDVYPYSPWFKTSAVVDHKGNEIETLNSRYTLVD